MTNSIGLHIVVCQQVCFTGAPFAFGTALLVVGFIVAATINKDKADQGAHTLSLADPTREPLIDSGKIIETTTKYATSHAYLVESSLVTSRPFLDSLNAILPLAQ